MEHYKILAETIESILKSIAIIVGGFWVYLKFVRNRENHSKIQFDIDLKVLGRQDSKILIEVSGTFINKGLVRHRVSDLTFDILILQNNAAVVQGDKRINYQVLFQKYNPKTDGEENTPVTWIPEDWYESFIDSNVEQKYSYLSSVPSDVTFISIFSKFKYRNSDFQTSQRTFNVSKLELENNSH